MRQTIRRALWITPLTIFVVVMGWTLAYGGKEVAERMIVDGHPFLPTVVVLAATGFIVADVWLYSRIIEPQRRHPSPVRR